MENRGHLRAHKKGSAIMMDVFWKDVICKLSAIGFLVFVYADYLFAAWKKRSTNTLQQVKDDV